MTSLFTIKYSKSLYSENPSSQKPVYVEADGENGQSKFICEKILALREKGIPLNQIAVLMRSGWHSNDLEVELGAHNIPFRKVGGFKFVESSHIKDLVSYLKVIFNPSDRLSWARVLGLMEGVGPKTIQTIVTYINNHLPNPTTTDFNSFKKMFCFFCCGFC